MFVSFVRWLLIVVLILDVFLLSTLVYLKDSRIWVTCCRRSQFSFCALLKVSPLAALALNDSRILSGRASSSYPNVKSKLSSYPSFINSLLPAFTDSSSKELVSSFSIKMGNKFWISLLGKPASNPLKWRSHHFSCKFYNSLGTWSIDIINSLSSLIVQRAALFFSG